VGEEEELRVDRSLVESAMHHGEMFQRHFDKLLDEVERLLGERGLRLMYVQSELETMVTHRRGATFRFGACKLPGKKYYWVHVFPDGKVELEEWDVAEARYTAPIGEGGEE